MDSSKIYVGFWFGLASLVVLDLLCSGVWNRPVWTSVSSFPQQYKLFDSNHGLIAAVNFDNLNCCMISLSLTQSLTRATQRRSPACPANRPSAAGRCQYEVSYSDGSYTKGTLALETLTFGVTAVHNAAIGCGHKNHGLFVGAAGLLGLDGASMSFIGQLGGQMGGAFSYRLLSRGTESNGSLVFGRDSMPVGATWVPLLRNPQAPSFYYIGLAC